MWLFTPFGFFSVVRERTGKKLMVRARVQEDLDRLRDVYLPSLSGTKATPARDYPFRAFVEPTKFGAALAQIAKDIDYPNFKAQVGVQLGDRRERLYEKVWDVMRKVKPERLVVAGIQPVGVAPTPDPRGERISLQAKTKQTRPAVRSDWKTKPVPARSSRLLLDRRLSERELRSVNMGVIPQIMEDHWFVFREGDTLFFYRSWTGKFAWALQLERRSGGTHVVSAEVSQDPKLGFRRTDRATAVRLLSMVEIILFRGRSSDRSDERLLRDWGWRPVGSQSSPQGR